MTITGTIWLDRVINKLKVKHHVCPEEVEQVFSDRPKFRFIQKGQRKSEDVYFVLGQSESGRYLAVIFVHKKTGEALILSARTMASKEKKLYGKK